jgi:phosphoribosylaminoimidazole carboxylase PurE protein
MKTVKPLVGIVMGSKSDIPVMNEAGAILDSFGVSYETRVSSAHRSPDRTTRYAKEAKRKGLKVIIAGAGGAAHLSGAIASQTVLPVIAVPLQSPLNGLDSFYATFQMPAGVPVATMGIGKSGAKNAAFLALQILGTKYPVIQKKLMQYKKHKGSNTSVTGGNRL